MTTAELLATYLDLLKKQDFEAAKRLRLDNKQNERFESLCQVRDKIMPVFMDYWRENQDSLDLAMSESDPEIKNAMIKSWTDDMAEKAIEHLDKKGRDNV